MHLYLNVQAELPVERRRNSSLFSVQQACYFLKQGDAVRLVDGRVLSVEANDRKLLRVLVNGQWFSHLKVSEIVPCDRYLLDIQCVIQHGYLVA